MRAATSARSMPERRIAHAVSAMPPAPALANRRVAAWPARLIWVLAHRPMREPEPPCSATAENSTMCPRNESTSKASASVEPAHVAVADPLPGRRQVGEGRREQHDRDHQQHRGGDEEQRLARGDAAEREGVLGGRFDGCGDGDGHGLKSRRPGSTAQAVDPPVCTVRLTALIPRNPRAAGAPRRGDSTGATRIAPRGPSHPETARQPPPRRGPDRPRGAAAGRPAVRRRPALAGRGAQRRRSGAAAARAAARAHAAGRPDGRARSAAASRLAPVALPDSPQQQLDWEARHRMRAALAAAFAAVAIIVGPLVESAIEAGAPSLPLLDALRKLAAPGTVLRPAHAAGPLRPLRRRPRGRADREPRS